MIVESPKRLNKLMNPDDVESSIYIKIDTFILSHSVEEN